jgi:hypothetical protein
MVRLACELCPRHGQYRKDTLIVRFGGEVLMPDARHLIAQCSHQGCAGRLLRCATRICAKGVVERSPLPKATRSQRIAARRSPTWSCSCCYDRSCDPSTPVQTGRPTRWVDRGEIYFNQLRSATALQTRSPGFLGSPVSAAATGAQHSQSFNGTGLGADERRILSQLRAAATCAAEPLRDQSFY